MGYRMIAIDLDGTLLAPDGTVSPRAKAAVHKALAAGLLVCFATGRNFTESQMVLDAVVFVANADHAPRLDAPKPTDPHVPCKQ